MLDPETEELLKIIDELIVATRKGDFQWRSVNPTTYVWDGTVDRNTPARLSLQRIAQKQALDIAGMKIYPRNYYIFQVSEISAQGTDLKLNISGAGEELLNDKLDRLYMLIVSGVTEKGVQFLKRIVPNPEP